MKKIKETTGRAGQITNLAIENKERIIVVFEGRDAAGKVEQLEGLQNVSTLGILK